MARPCEATETRRPKGTTRKTSSAYVTRETVVVSDARDGDTVSRTLAVALPKTFPTATSAKRACRRKTIARNGEIVGSGDRVASGDVLEVLTRNVPGRGARGELGLEKERGARKMVVLYEDAHAAIAVKPDDCATIGPGSGGGWSAERMLAISCEVSAADFGVLTKPKPCHRLDEPTGGILVCAKTREGLTTLSSAFASREVKKRYRAILRGRLEKTSGVVDAPVSGRDASTEYAVVLTRESERYGTLTLVDFFPRTGRTHQLRRHSVALGAPILGDVRYGRFGKDEAHPDGLFLWAVGVVIPAKWTPWRGEECGDLVIDTNEDEKFARALAECECV